MIAKSSITIDVKPWDDETDLLVVEKMVRAIIKDGLVWGASKLVPMAYGINKLQIICVVEDLKVGSDDLIEEIQGFEDHVSRCFCFVYFAYLHAARGLELNELDEMAVILNQFKSS